MSLENYKISKLPYIENGSNEIMKIYIWQGVSICDIVSYERKMAG